MIVNLGHGYVARWNRGHTINFYDESGREYDCCTFAWDKDNPTFMDAWSAFYSYENERV